MTRFGKFSPFFKVFGNFCGFIYYSEKIEHILLIVWPIFIVLNVQILKNITSHLVSLKVGLGVNVLRLY